MPRLRCLIERRMSEDICEEELSRRADDEEAPRVDQDSSAVVCVLRDTRIKANVLYRPWPSLPFRIEEDLKSHLQNLPRQDGKRSSGVLRSLVRCYVQDRDRGAALRALWTQIERRAEKAGTGREGRHRHERIRVSGFRRLSSSGSSGSGLTDGGRFAFLNRS